MTRYVLARSRAPVTASDPRSPPQALKVLDVVAPPTASRFSTHRVRPRRPPLARDGRDAARLGARGDPRPRRDPARRRRRPERPVRRPRARAAAQAALRARPLRQPAPVQAVPGRRRRRSRDPGDIDFVVVREGTEGPYVGNGGAIRVGTPHELATEVSINTAFGVERVVRDAFARAQARPRKKLTLVHKNNVLVHAGHLWTRTVDAVATEFPDVSVDYLHVDAATIFLVTDPARFDVIVTDNLFGDILTDLAAADHRRHRPGRQRQRQPRPHDAQHVRAGPRLGPRHRRAVARPTRPPRSCRARMLLEHLGLPEAAAQITAAVEADIAERGGTARSTEEVGEAIARACRTTGRRRIGRLTTVTLRPRKYYRDHHDLHRRSPRPSSRTRRRETAEQRDAILADPGFGNHFTDHMFLAEWTPDTGWADARVVPVRPAADRPGHGGPALRAGDLRGPQGVRPRRRLGLAVPARGQRRPHAALGAPPGAARAARSTGSSARSSALVEADRAWVPAGGEKSLYLRPFMFASEVFLGVRPSQHVTYSVIASPAGAYFAGGVQAVSIWLSTRVLPRRRRRHGRRQVRRQLRRAACCRSRRPPSTAAPRSRSSTRPSRSGSRSSAG